MIDLRWRNGRYELTVVSAGFFSRNRSEAVFFFQIEHSFRPLGDDHAFTVLDARCVSRDDSIELNCIASSIVDDSEKPLLVSKTSTDLHWIVFEKSNYNQFEF